MQISLTFVNEFVKWPRPLNLIGRLKLGHPGWQLFKLVAKRQQEKQMSLGKENARRSLDPLFYTITHY